MYNPAIHHRRSIRLKGYDYSKEGLYFITLICANRRHLFGKVTEGKMLLNTYGQIAQEEWLKTIEIRDNVSLDAFVIMPNHMHGIIRIDYQIKSNTKQDNRQLQSPSKNLGAIIRGYKGATTKRIKIASQAGASEGKGVSPYVPDSDLCKGVSPYAQTADPATGVSPAAPAVPAGSIWQRNYYEIIIWDEKAYRNISRYIIDNPRNWGKDKFRRKK